MAKLLVVINGEPIAVEHHNLRTVGSCVTEAFTRSRQRRADAHYLVQSAAGDDLSSKDRIDYLDRIFVTLDASPILNRDPGDETDHRHRFDELTATCACGATHEQLRRH